MTEPASIRYNNPGAMWGGSRARKWGATDDLILNDGQANHIAVFPTPVDGAAAQFDLWCASYVNMSLGAAVRKWSGGNSSSAYLAFLEKHAGISPSEQITRALLASARGLALMKAQAQWEAGKPYPMSDAEWNQAQAMVFAPVPLPPDVPPIEKPKAKDIAPHVSTTGGAIAGAAAHWLGLPLWAVLSAAFIVAIAAYLIIRNRSKK